MSEHEPSPASSAVPPVIETQPDRTDLPLAVMPSVIAR